MLLLFHFVKPPFLRFLGEISQNEKPVIPPAQTPPLYLRRLEKQSHAQRLKMLCTAWATQGYGAPLFTYLFYVFKRLLLGCIKEVHIRFAFAQIGQGN